MKAETRRCGATVSRMADVSDQAEQVGRKADNSEWLDRGVRFGMICYGVVYLLIAWLALQLALGHQSANASNKGAMQMLGNGCASTRPHASLARRAR